MAPQHEQERAVRERTLLYNRDGLTVERMQTVIATVIEMKQANELVINGRASESVRPEYAPEIAVYYTQPSDPLRLMGEVLSRPENSLAGRKVLTVAGSGDLPLFFATQNTEQTDCYDISAVACAMTEAKLQAIKSGSLSMEQYAEMFHIPDAADFDDADDAGQARVFFHPEHYDLLRPRLTPQATQFLDMATDREMQELVFAYDMSDMGMPYDVFRDRQYSGGITLADVIPALKDQTRYAKLQAILRAQKNSIRRRDLRDLSRKDLSAYDYVFMSNIGFDRASMIIDIIILLKKGVKRIGLTIQSAGQNRQDSTTNAVDWNGQIVPAAESRSGGQTQSVVTIKGQELIPGTTIEIDGIKIRILCHDNSSPTIPIYAEVHASDNEDTIFD